MLFGKYLTKMVNTDIQTGSVAALIGEPAIGKSSFFKALAKENGTRAFVLGCNTLSDKADLTAPRLLPTPDGSSFSQEFFPHQEIQEAIEYARAHPRENPVLVLDEINRSNSDITSAVLTLSTDRKIGREKLPDNLAIVVAGNDRGNVIALDSASLTRFSIYHVEPDAQVFIELMGDELNYHIKAVLTAHPEYIFMKPQVDGVFQDGDDNDDDDGSMSAAKIDMFEDAEDMLQFTAPRTIEYLSNALNHIGDDGLFEWIQVQSRYTRPNGEVRQLSLLEEFVEARVGSTLFADAVVHSIIQASLSGASGGSSSRKVAPKPSFFDELAALSTQQELENYVSGISNRELSQALVYAIFEKKDNARLITAITSAFTVDDQGAPAKLDTESSTMLINLGQEGQLDSDNIKAMLDVKNNLASSLGSTLDMLGIG